jgi:hypothetical protein
VLVVDLSALFEVRRNAGISIADDERLEEHHRVHVDDPFGNRIELMEPTARR